MTTMKRNRLIFLLLSMIIVLLLSTAEAEAFLLTVNPTNGGDVTSMPQGIDCGGACSANFRDFSAVQLTATAFPGYGFVNWSGDCLGTGRTATVFMNRAKTCTANFVPCDFSFTPSDRIIPETGGDYTVAVSTTPFNCSWDAYADYSWIEITSGASGSGAGVIRYTVDPNTNDRIRQGYISLSEAETSFLITQEGPGSGYFQNPNTGTDSYGHIYKRFDMLMNWQDAETFCEGRGGYLATITDYFEQAFVYNNLVYGAIYDFHQCWLGGFQPAGSPDASVPWQWVTDEPWSYAQWYYDGNNPPIPLNDITGNQDSLLMLGDWAYGAWIDVNGALLRQSFVCEWTNLQHLLTVSKTGTGSGSVNSSEYPSPSIDCCSGACAPICSALYSPNTRVILNAIPDADSVFIGWSGACTGTGSCFVSMNNDKDVTAMFNLRQYTVSAQAGQGGSISPQSALVYHGDSAQFNITVNPGFSIASAAGCGGSLDGLTYYTGPITANCTVQVTFAVSEYTVSTSAGQGGAIAPASVQVTHGNTAQFTITSDTGYHLLFAGGCGALSESSLKAAAKKKKKGKVKALAVTTYTTGPITENCTVTATFELDTYTVTASAGPGGSISPSGATTVNHGGTPVFTVTPDPGYHITGVNGTCGGSLVGNTYTANSVTGDCTVQASFAANEYAVSTSAGPNGGISPASVQVLYGNTAQFTITPDTGYHIASVNGCGGALSESSLKASAKKKKKVKGKVKALAVSMYATGPIAENCTVTATFEIDTYTVTAEAGEGGSIDPSNITVNYGDTAQFTVTPDPGYHIVTVTGCGGSLDGNTYTTEPIAENCTVSSSFEAFITVTLLKSGNGNGAIIAQGLACEGNTCSGEYTHGTKVMVNVQPEAGFRVADVRIDGVPIGAMNTFTFKRLTGNHTVEIIFAPL
jgi:hypothetical protein